jgi:hypothetical protein
MKITKTNSFLYLIIDKLTDKQNVIIQNSLERSQLDSEFEIYKQTPVNLN